MDTNLTDKPTQKRGFAALNPEKRRAIAKMGGSSVRPEDRAYSKDRALAAAAGAIGGSRPAALTEWKMLVG